MTPSERKARLAAPGRALAGARFLRLLVRSGSAWTLGRGGRRGREGRLSRTLRILLMLSGDEMAYR